MIKASLSEIVGAEYVSDDIDVKLYSGDRGPTGQKMPGYVARPKNTAEVQKIVQLANEQKVPIIPSSSSIHFNGATTPVPGGIVLDLRRMNRILEVDEQNRKVMVEPGVTWDQIGPALRKHQLMVQYPLLPHARRSVVTSCLEREPALNPKYEYGEPITSLEMVWPTGEVFRIGTASVPGFPNSASQGAYPYGPGPLDPLRLLQGAQGTMGVVTWANIRAEYLPQVNKSFLLFFERAEDVTEAIYAIQKRRIGNECLALNSLNLASILAKGGTGDIIRLRQELPPWALLLVLGGPRWFPEEKIAYEEEALNKVRDVSFPSAEVKEAVPGFGSAGKLPDLLRNPWPEDTAYWRLRYKGNCQEVSFITVIEDLPKFVDTMRRVAGIHGYDSAEIGVYLQPIEYSAACHLEFDLYYDGNSAAEVERVDRLFTVAVQELLNLGAHFTRPYDKRMANLVYEKAGSYTMLLKKVKGILDPNGVMNPGKLCF